MQTRTHDLLRTYVARHNHGVATGDFGPMLQLFAPTAEVHFADIPFGPFIGRDAIAEEYAVHPPIEELTLLDIQEYEGAVHASYGWRSAPQTVAGVIHARIADGRIVRWEIQFTVAAAP
ncbi:MAG: nuclear transport factor 2 family protein [Bacteroidetes bacterium]|nr:nuclear transport factor 2 family protein [Bacteroidota bacterium]